MDSQHVAGRAPMPAQRTLEMHNSGGGFCTVCGTVWPCSQAQPQGSDDKTLAHT
jgi:hypothetical protein